MLAVLKSEVTMSKLNGDKSRFHRLRKAGLRRREQARLTWATAKNRPVPIDPGSVSEQPGAVRGVAPNK
jgi:hypothetical protein